MKDEMVRNLPAMLTNVFRNGSREGFYHSQWSSNFIAIFDGNYKFLPSIDLEKFYGQLIKF